MSEQVVVIDGYDVPFKILTHDTEHANSKAVFAMELMRHLAICAGADNGEDSAGRHKIRLMTPNEVAGRACEISENAFKEFGSRGWLLPVPDFEAASAQAREQHDKHEQKDAEARAARRAAAMERIATTADTAEPNA